MKKKMVTTMLAGAAAAAPVAAQTYGDEGPTLHPNRLGLVYENAIDHNEEGKVDVHRVSYKVEGIDVVANVYTPAGYTPQGQYAAVVVAAPRAGNGQAPSHFSFVFLFKWEGRREVSIATALFAFGRRLIRPAPRCGSPCTWRAQPARTWGAWCSSAVRRAARGSAA